jgi:hypothetical protein
MNELDKLQTACEKLLSLLNDRKSGLVVWNNFLVYRFPWYHKFIIQCQELTEILLDGGSSCPYCDGMKIGDSDNRCQTQQPAPKRRERRITMTSFNDFMDVHEAAMAIDREILAYFWNPKNENETIGDIKKILTTNYRRLGKIKLLMDSESRALNRK